VSDDYEYHAEPPEGAPRLSGDNLEEALEYLLRAVLLMLNLESAADSPGKQKVVSAIEEAKWYLELLAWEYKDWLEELHRLSDEQSGQ
jgi:hypothetical protein